MAGSGGGLTGPQVAGPTQFDELIPVIVVVVLWVITWITSGTLVAAQTSWIFLIVLPLGGWALLMRLHFDRDFIERTIGPFRQRVQLDALASIEFKQTGAWRSQGMLFVSDTRGDRVGIYVGRFSRAAEWSACSWPRQKPHTHRCSHGRAAFSKGQSLTAITTPTDADTSEQAAMGARPPEHPHLPRWARSCRCGDQAVAASHHDATLKHGPRRTPRPWTQLWGSSDEAG